jgi:hypothetical protein
LLYQKFGNPASNIFTVSCDCIVRTSCVHTTLSMAINKFRSRIANEKSQLWQRSVFQNPCLTNVAVRVFCVVRSSWLYCSSRTNFHGFCTDFHGLLRIVTDFYGFSRIVTDCYGFSRIFS